MLEKERDEIIIHVLSQSTFATVHDITRLTAASEATVRRDLARLELNGRIIRIRGGAQLSDKGKSEDTTQKLELPFNYRKGIQQEVKRNIARKAVSLIQENETIIIDGGSTTFQMVEFLAGLHLNILTNSFAIAEYLNKNGNSQIILSGGIIYPESQLILDHFNQDPFENYHVTKVFMSAMGINKSSITNTEVELIQTERAMIKHTDELIILADSRKFDKNGNLNLCELEQVHTIITDSGINDEYRTILEQKGIRLIIA